MKLLISFFVLFILKSISALSFSPDWPILESIYMNTESFPYCKLNINKNSNKLEMTFNSEGLNSEVFKDGYLYITDQTKGFVIIGDIKKQRFINKIEVGKWPTSPVFYKEYLFVANQASGTISIIDPKINSVIHTKSVEGWPFSMLIHDDYLYIAYRWENRVEKIDLRDFLKAK